MIASQSCISIHNKIMNDQLCNFKNEIMLYHVHYVKKHYFKLKSFLDILNHIINVDYIIIINYFIINIIKIFFVFFFLFFFSRNDRMFFLEISFHKHAVMFVLMILL